jgi:hypothetical protein
MATETAASTVGVVTALRSVSRDWPDELWAMSVGLFDAIIRTFYRVCEFTDDPACVLRVGLSPARAPVSLSDGTRVEIGGLVGTLHFGISICHALSPADPTPLGLRSAKPGPAFASCAGPLCRERTRSAADTGASRRCRTVSSARDIAGATRGRTIRI